eukprot:5708190-Amphidinium_carterae.1
MATSKRLPDNGGSIVLPGLVTSLCHANCLGAWTYFWEPCRALHSFNATFEEDQKSTIKDDIFGDGVETFNAINVDLVSRTDMCSL